MAEFLARLFLLLLPVALLLLAGLRLKRRAVFPHGYFPASRTRAADILLRSLRLRYDLILDALAALVVALALSGFPRRGPGRSAAVIDGSRSMLRERPGPAPWTGPWMPCTPGRTWKAPGCSSWISTPPAEPTASGTSQPNAGRTGGRPLPRGSAGKPKPWAPIGASFRG
ncbi:MAG: hypothetical protein M0C28_43580 [Candidatus Moduliflexus flocculans]|nr:hypothetical protein [Candidatus Moduliflexus flocculans]